MNEQTIREAYGQHCCASGLKQTVGGYIMFKAGYLALLNSLERAGGCGGADLYYLPDGVTRD